MKRSVIVADEKESENGAPKKLAKLKTTSISSTEGGGFGIITDDNEIDRILNESREVTWTKIEKECLDCDYGQLFTKGEARHLFRALEAQLDYYSGDLTKVFVCGKWHQIPRKQVAYGDSGVSYKFSGTLLPARSWTSNHLVDRLRQCVTKVTGFQYNFVLINRYASGMDSIGEHKDDEEDLDPQAPITSLSLGVGRDFVLRHELLARGRGRGRLGSSGGDTVPAPVTLCLEPGSLLLLNPPTNHHWYHSLPKRKRVTEARINFTFRVMSKKAYRDTGDI